MAVPLLCGTALLLTSCKQEIDVLENIPSLEKLPEQIVYDFQTVYTDSGLVQIIAESPHMISYDDKDAPYSEFPEGIKVRFYNGTEEVQSRLSAKFAIYYHQKGLWEARDSVVAVNQKQEVLETELLFWNEREKSIYSDKFVKVTTAQQVIMGEKFESNQDFTDWTIHEVSGTFYLKDEKK